jgi:molybdopterin-containing oxidoreductase family iron-sulfur binding subunit
VGNPSDTYLDRRTFLGLAGAAGLAASCSPAAPTQKLIPYLVPPEDIVPGMPLFYRTVCRECAAGCGVTARTREGRAVKLEGNPEDPIGRGSLCARGQASLQSLYHPERFEKPARRRPDGTLADVTWDDAEATLAQAMDAARGKGPGRIRLVTRFEPGLAGAVQVDLMRALGARPADRLVLEPLDAAPVRAASSALFGRDELPVFDLQGARSVVAFGADFVETWVSPVELARQLAGGRGVVGDARTRVTWVGPRLSVTGLAADHWLRARSGGEVAVALALLRVVLDPRSGLAPASPLVTALRQRVEVLSPEALASAAGVPWSELEALGRELVTRRPSALLGPGPASSGSSATRLAGLVLLLNHLLGNVGRTVSYGLDARADRPSTLAEARDLAGAMTRGEVDVLLVHHADPVGTLPRSFGFGEAITKVPLVVSFGLRPDPTAMSAHLLLPDRHTLESFGDVLPRKGIVGLAQPVMTPLGDTRPATQVLVEVSNKLTDAKAHLPTTELFDALMARVDQHAKAAGVAETGPAMQRRALEHGGLWHEAGVPREAPAPVVKVAEALVAQPLEPVAPADGLRLVVFPTALRGDGRSADLPWLREVPDTLSSVSWTAWCEVSPATAKRLGVVTGDPLTLTTAAGRSEVRAWVSPTLRDDVVAVPLGGPEALALVPAAIDVASGVLAWSGASISVARVGGRRGLPIFEGSPYQHGREVVPTVTSAKPTVPRPDLSARMYSAPPHPEHRWGMAIDLDRCTGCQACTVACYAENNVPVMGPQAAMEGRNMAWLRIERYLGDEPGGELDVRLLPMLCQHCTNAPCEPVCPVYATYHNSEGLNVQVYNRCVGTRYCSNNCPYKVRTFNWRDPTFAPPLTMQLNPDVTVRSRGVMEKCTFCVQRIRFAENQAKTQGRPVADGDVTPACVQACPSQAMTFGDLVDPASRVSALARDPRGFAALEDVGTLPAITYLARVRDEGES